MPVRFDSSLLGAVVGLIIFWTNLGGVSAQTQSITITATSITTFDLNNPARRRFGKLEFVGGLVLRSPSKNFGAFSGLRLSDQDLLTAITDTGYWLQGHIERDKNGVPMGLAKARMAPLLNNFGKPFGNKWFADAEGLTFAGGFAFVGMEQNTRILRFFAGKDLFASKSTTLPRRKKSGSFRSNNGYEAVASFPSNHPLSGGILGLRENWGRGATFNRGVLYGLNGEDNGQFSVEGDGSFAITDADFLPSGDLLLLERRFTMGWGAQARIRRIKGMEIRDGAKLEGKIIFEAGSGQLLDNMEGLSVFTGPKGKLRIGMISDNNHWPLQRTIYLEFMISDLTKWRFDAGQ